jgi:hypothetical protein
MRRQRRALLLALPWALGAFASLLWFTTVMNVAPDRPSLHIEFRGFFANSTDRYLTLGRSALTGVPGEDEKLSSYYFFRWLGVSYSHLTYLRDGTPKTSNAGENVRFVGFQYWLVFLALGTASLATMGLLLKEGSRRRRDAAGLCRICGYDLRATPERCPECGSLSKSGPRPSGLG